MYFKIVVFSFFVGFGCLFPTTNLIAQQASIVSTTGLTKGPAERFIGNVWVQYFVNDTSADFLSSKVIFEPNARSNWHVHVGRQIILAVEGEGYYKEKGKPTKVLTKGDVVVIESGTIHSHGSIHSKSFTQVVTMNNIKSKDATTWLEREIGRAHV